MTSQGGRRRAANLRPPVPKARIGLHTAIALATGAAWVYLVRAAIDFGALARGGQGLAWLFAALATLGAVGCLLLAILMVTRVLVLIGALTEQRPSRPPARRKAK